MTQTANCSMTNTPTGVSYTAHTCTYTLTGHEVSIPVHSPQFDRAISSTRCKGTYRTFLLLHCIGTKDDSSYITTVSSQGQCEFTVGHRPHLTQPTPTTEMEAKGLKFCEVRYYVVIVSTAVVMQYQLQYGTIITKNKFKEICSHNQTERNWFP
jgi:hypothetical protein